MSLWLIWVENRWYNVICADMHIFHECREIPCNNLDGVEKMGLFDKILGTYSEREVMSEKLHLKYCLLLVHRLY